MLRALATHAVIVLEEIVFRIDFVENVKHRHDVLGARVDGVEEQIRPIHSYAADAVDMIPNVIDNDELFGYVRQLDEDFITFALHFRWRSGENHAHQLLRLVDPDLQTMIK